MNTSPVRGNQRLSPRLSPICWLHAHLAATLRAGFRQALRTCRLLVAALAVLPALGVAAPDVQVTVKPVHSLVSRVMMGVARPGLLIDGAQSPHGASLRPAQARALQRADVVFWLGKELEANYARALNNIAQRATVVGLLRAGGLNALPFRQGVQDLRQRSLNHHANERNPDHDHGHRDDEHHHDHDAIDPHVWLDPLRAAAIGQVIAATLAQADPANAEVYQRNARLLENDLNALNAELAEKLTGLAQHPALVFHDAYQYFERRYGLHVAAIVTFNPEIPGSARHIKAVRHQLSEGNVRCAFTEPQFSQRSVQAVLSGTGLTAAVLDPMGAEIAAGPDHYMTMMRAMAASVAAACLATR